MADLIASELDEEAGPFHPLIREIPMNPPSERLGHRIINSTVSCLSFHEEKIDAAILTL